jgi:hypothetical protein
MTQEPTAPARNEGRNGTRALLLSGAFLLVLGGAVWTLVGGDDRPFVAQSATPTASAIAWDDASEWPGYPPLDLPQDSLESAWTRERALLREDSAAIDELLASWHALQLVSALRALEIWEGDWEALHAEHTALLHEFVRTHGVDVFRAVSHVAWDRFAASLYALLRAAETSGSVESLLGNPLDPIVHAHLEAGGDFVRQGLRSGALSDEGSLHVPPSLLRVIFRYGWLAQARDLLPMEALVPGDELKLFLRWRIEQAEGIDSATRLRWQDEYSAMFGPQGSRPNAYWRAYLLHTSGHAEQAQVELRRLAEDDPSYARWVSESLPP